LEVYVSVACVRRGTAASGREHRAGTSMVGERARGEGKNGRCIPDKVRNRYDASARSR
jgi:hypothetical protein